MRASDCGLTVGHDEGAVCVCVPEHRPPVLELHRHHRWPLYLGGPDTEANLVWVCPTTHANTHELLTMMVKADRPLGETELENLSPRPVSRYASILARRGFIEYKAHLSGG